MSRTVLLLLLAVAAAGCQSARVPAPIVGAPVPLEVERLVVEHSVEGRPIEALVLGDGAETVLVLASIHGDEAAGTPLVHELIERLRDDPRSLDGRRLVAVPVVNPDGIARGTRRNAHGVDLNRDFPAANQRRAGPHPGEPESRAVLALVERFRPARIITIHQPADRLDYDGPARALAEAMAAVSPLEVRRMGARPGSLGSWAGVDLGLEVITVELPRAADEQLPSRRWELYGEMLLVALRHPGAVRAGLGESSIR